MEFLDKDLVSIQETRGLIRKAKEAQSKLARMSQQDIDRIVKAMLLMKILKNLLRWQMRKQDLVNGKIKY